MFEARFVWLQIPLPYTILHVRKQGILNTWVPLHWLIARVSGAAFQRGKRAGLNTRDLQNTYMPSECPISTQQYN